MSRNKTKKNEKPEPPKQQQYKNSNNKTNNKKNPVTIVVESIKLLNNSHPATCVKKVIGSEETVQNHQQKIETTGKIKKEMVNQQILIEAGEQASQAAGFPGLGRIIFSTLFVVIGIVAGTNPSSFFGGGQTRNTGTWETAVDTQYYREVLKTVDTSHKSVDPRKPALDIVTAFKYDALYGSKFVPARAIISTFDRFAPLSAEESKKLIQDLVHNDLVNYFPSLLKGSARHCIKWLTRSEKNKDDDFASAVHSDGTCDGVRIVIDSEFATTNRAVVDLMKALFEDGVASSVQKADSENRLIYIAATNQRPLEEIDSIMDGRTTGMMNIKIKLNEKTRQLNTDNLAHR